MKIKEVHRTANVAWSTAKQDKILLAAGTAAQQLDASFSTNAELEIFDPEVSASSMDMKCLGKITTSQRFHSLAWGGLGVGTSELPYGVIGGGMDNGTLMLWDPAKIVSGDGQDALKAQVTHHTGPVRCLDFNPFQQNLIASGGSNSDIFIWDVNNMDKPMAPGAKPTISHADIMGVSWNKHVSHIMASTSVDGLSVVWDLRASRPIIQFSDSGPVKGRCVDVEWNPETATQLVTASEDDRAPVIQLWDLRNAYSPLRTMEQHTRGILVIAWCPKDADMLLSCGKDNRTLLWNPNNQAAPRGEVVAEFPPSANWNFDIKWCPRNPALVASSSFAGSMSVYDLASSREAAPQPAIPGNDWLPQQPAQAAVRLQKAPKWLKRPCGATFSFGGRLVRFSSATKEVKVTTVATEKEVVARALSLQQALESNQLEAYCAQRAQGSEGQDRNIWAYLQATFAADKRPMLLDLLGYPKPPPPTAVTDGQQPAPAAAEPAQDDAAAAEKSDGESSDDPFASITPGNFAHILPSVPITISTADDVEGQISKAVLVGDFEKAVQVALDNDMLAEALLLATLGDKALLLRVQTAYLAKKDTSLNQLLTSVVKADWSGLVCNVVIANWRETFALILTYAPDNEFASLCETLGDRLYGEGDNEYRSDAIILYIVAGSVPKMVDAWTVMHGSAEGMGPLLDLVEHVSVLAKGAGVTRIEDQATASKYIRYAELVASQGYLDIAAKVFSECAPDTPGLPVLQDRVFHARPAYQGEVAPTFPFERVNILSQEEMARLHQAAAPVQAPAATHAASQQPWNPQGGYNQTYQQPPQYGAPSYGAAPGYPQQYAPPPSNQYGAPPSFGQPQPQYPQQQGFPPANVGGQQFPPPPAGNFGASSSSFPPPPPASSGPQPTGFYQPGPPPTGPTHAPPPGGPAPGIFTPGPPPASGFGSSAFPPGPPGYHKQTSNPGSMGLTPQPGPPPSTMPPLGPPPSGGFVPQQSAPGQRPGPPQPPAGTFVPQAMPPGPPSMPPSTFPGAPGMPPGPPGGMQGMQGSYPGGMNMGNMAMPPMGPMGGPGPAPAQPPPQPAAPPPPAPKKPIPAEHQPLVERLNRSIDRAAAINNVTAKKKTDDIRNRMEALYDLLRENRVDAITLGPLNDLIGAMEARNYGMCLNVFNHMVQGDQGHGKWLLGIKSLFQLLQQYPNA